MKRIIFSLAVLLCASQVSAQDFKDLDKSPADIAAFPSKYNISDKLVRITYSRPQLKGRDVADLAPAGKVWRTGANEAAEITFYKDAKIGGKNVKAGTYSLFTIPGEGEWAVILNNNLNQWGAYSYENAADVLRVKAKATTSDTSLEAFSVAFDDDGNLFMGWGNVRVEVPMSYQ
ncbi:DUF2911 domain-containing protein [Croceivirga thetidis]|uniref:DUF2911 domain-containing protein n=1 Tax=Croceivirga thetidis TaxID=2721623 RepID=A0ABX1GT25_9FLAO|nr:DUF2911 domain-containing protein [Croceivirga thetidis]NKI33112.1 DUF2911 domain-containing protein [Croceivirga thetidis]